MSRQKTPQQKWLESTIAAWLVADFELTKYRTDKLDGQYFVEFTPKKLGYHAEEYAPMLNRKWRVTLEELE